ncbi:MAG: LPS export ABC transporter permease LptF, partial [Rhodobacteraceae bacterium]|nr:LPS export ABC transporter permease LptF [Paracoccaceae bacterium]
LFCIAAALVGFSTLLIGGYSRFGVWREVILAFALLLVIDGLRSTLIDQVLGNARLWPILYIPAIVGLSLGALMLWIASRPSLLRRRRKAPQESVS